MIVSLRDRLLLSVVLLVAVGLIAADVATYAALNSFLLKRVDDQLTATSPFAAGQLAGDNAFGGPGFGPGPHPGGQRGPAPDRGLPTGTYSALYSPSSSLITEQTLNFTGVATAAKPTLPKSLPHGAIDVPTLITTGGSDGTSYRVMVETIDSPPSAYGDVLVVAIPLTEVESILNQLLALEALISSLVLLAIALLVVVVLRAGVRPLEKMGETAAAIAAGDLSRRVEPATRRTEIGRLGLALNTMLAQIEEAFAERSRSENRLRRFVADASHELRTPLTSIRGYAELLRRRHDLPPEQAASAHRRIEEEAIRMAALVDDLLLLARLDQGRPLAQEPVDLRRIVLETSADVAVIAPARPLKVEATKSVVISGDELRLRQVIANLVRNAVVHTPADSPIEVLLNADKDRAHLSVVDHGPGLDPELRERVFQPFFRADPGRSRDTGGAGLGLSIVAAVVTAHGGKVEALETEGGGSTFKVELPLANGRASSLATQPPDA